MANKKVNLSSAILAAYLAASSVARAADPYVVTIDLRADILALGDEDSDISSAAAARLLALGNVALPAVSAGLADESPAVRAGVVDVLRQVGPPQASAPLVRATGDPDATVRAEAVMALGLNRDLAGTAAVEAALRDPDTRVQNAAIAACNALCRSAEAIDAVVVVALRGAPGNPAISSFASIASSDTARAALARRSLDARAVPLLGGDIDARPRLQAALLIAAISDRRALPALRALLTEPSVAAARPQMIMALGGLREPAAAEALRGLTADPALKPLACQVLANLASQHVAGATPCP